MGWIFKGYKASDEVSLQVEEVNTLLDLSEIHHYPFNKKDKVFLKVRSSKLSKKEPQRRPCHAQGPQPLRLAPTKLSTNPRCHVCGWELITKNHLKDRTKDRRISKFCSIECKVTSCDHVQYFYLFIYLFLTC